MTCRYCGDLHRPDQLCKRGQLDVTRRSFCFLFGVGVAGTLLAPSLGATYSYQFTGLYRWGDETTPTSRPMLINSHVLEKRVYAGTGALARHIATVPRETAQMIVGDGELRFADAAGRAVQPRWIDRAHRPGQPLRRST